MQPPGPWMNACPLPVSFLADEARARGRHAKATRQRRVVVVVVLSIPGSFVGAEPGLAIRLSRARLPVRRRGRQPILQGNTLAVLGLVRAAGEGQPVGTQWNALTRI